MTTPTNPPRPLTNEELAMLIRLLRSQRQWSQEQLAEISGVNVLTVQRIERGEGANLHTRRALAQAFGMSDIDELNTPMQVPTAEESRPTRRRSTGTTAHFPLRKSSPGACSVAWHTVATLTSPG